MNNFEKIKNMTIEEMAEFLATNDCDDWENIHCKVGNNCKDCCIKYLQNEAV